VQAQDKKFFERVTEHSPNAGESDMSKKFNTTEGLWYKGMATFSIGGGDQIGVCSS